MNQTKKHTTGKKLLALLLALIMSVSLLPMSVFAADLEQTDADGQPVVEQGVDDAVPGETDGQDEEAVPQEPVEDVQEPAEDETDVTDADTQTMEGDVAVQAAVPLAVPVPDGFYRIFHLDCGRKYFDPDQIKALIKIAADNGYNYVELAIGNDGLRFLLNNMDVTVGETTYDGTKFAAGVKSGNAAQNSSNDNSWLTQKEMSGIISYAKGLGISIIPLLNSPGHMNAIIDGMENLGMSNVAVSVNGYGTSARTISLTNTEATEFTKALVAKYAAYFAGEGCIFFNLGTDEYANDKLGSFSSNGGAGFGYLINSGNYGKFVTYVNDLANIIKTAKMIPMAFNDGFYYNNNTSSGTFDTDVVICYWSAGYPGYSPTSAANLKDAGHTIISTNDAWYYVLQDGNSYYTYSHAKSGVEGTKCTAVVGDNTGIVPKGCMLAFWCDDPTKTYNDNEVSKVEYLISTLAKNNESYFVKTVEPDTTVSDKTESGETVAVTAPGLTGVTVTTATAPTVTNAAEGKVAAYDVKPSTESGSYTGEATVSFPIPTGWDANRVRGFVVNSDKSVTDNLTGKVVDGKFQFTAPHFSVMGIYELSATAATKTEPITLTVGQTSTEYTQDGDVTNDVDTSNYDASIASYTAKYKNIQGGTTRVLGTKYTSFTTSGSTGLITDNAGNYMVIDSNGSISNTTDINQATLFTVKRTRNASTYTIQGNGYYLRLASSGVSTNKNSGTSLSLASNNGFYVYDSGYYRLNYNGSGNWGATATTSGSGTYTGTGHLYSYSENTTPSVNGTVITFKGLAVGETSVQIGDTLYTIVVEDKAPDNALTGTSIILERWITNYPVYSSESTSSVKTQTIASSDAKTDVGIEIAKVAVGSAYSNFDGWRTVYYWQAMRLDENSKQTMADKDDKTSVGTTLTHVRYHNNAWQYKTADGVWHYFESGDQLVAYYLQKLTVTKEITTYSKDWGFETNDITANSDKIGQVALTVAVVYPGGTVSPAESAMYASSTLIYNYWSGGRDIGIVAPANNSDYVISKITVTDGKRDRADVNSSSEDDTWKSTDSITWNKKENAAGSEWYDETEVWNKSSGTVPVVNGKASNIIWEKKNSAKLILIYLEAVEKETNLNVQYIDLNANNSVFHSYQVAMKYTQGEDAPTFTSALKNANNRTSWPSNDPTSNQYLPDDAYVTNASNTNETFNKDITTIPDISGIYASGLYEYIRADISEDGKTLRLYYNLRASTDTTYVVDFGLPVVIPFSAFGIDNASSVTVSFDEKTLQLTRRGNYGDGVINKDKETVTYTLFKPLDTKTPIPVYVTDSKGNTVMRSVNVIPASTVYYEDSFAKFYGSDGVEQKEFAQTTDSDTMGTWYVDGAAQNSTPTQALEELGKKQNVYGYDSAYTQDNSTTFSMGSAKKVTVDATKFVYDPTVKFTFKGTGFDVISLTDNNSGAIVVNVERKDTNTTGYEAYNKNFLVNNYYGYSYDKTTDEWTVDNSDENNALYQIPVMKVTGLPYGEYAVTITVGYGEFFDKTNDGKYSFWMDAIRVYDPMGKDYDYKNGDDTDNESYPQYIKLRNALAKDDGSVTTNSQLLFIDGAQNAEITLYKNYGPNNEVYLAKGQAISFKVPSNEAIASIQIGAKAPQAQKAGAATMAVTNATLNAGMGNIDTATEMYYELNGAKGQTVTITNTGNGILSLTNLKITFTAKQNSTITLAALSDEEQANAVAAVRALFAAPVEPEPDPEPETFEPDRFDVSWNRSTVKVGQKATLTVKTSEDVDAITVDGVTFTNYRTRTQREGWGWNAKKVTYREFTYTVTAAEAGTLDVSVAAVNAEGVSSAAVTATLTVQAASQRPGIGGWLDNIFGRWF